MRSAADALVHGPALYAQRVGALVVKRAACARRDRLAVVTQLAVPIALVLTALWTGKAYVNAPDEPPLFISRCAGLQNTWMTEYMDKETLTSNVRCGMLGGSVVLLQRTSLSTVV